MNNLLIEALKELSTRNQRVDTISLDGTTREKDMTSCKFVAKTTDTDTQRNHDYIIYVSLIHHNNTYIVTAMS